MRWGETYHDRNVRLKQWHKKFALLPTKMDCGRWVWLEKYQCRRSKYCDWAWHKRLILSLILLMPSTAHAAEAMMEMSATVIDPLEMNDGQAKLFCHEHPYTYKCELLEEQWAEEEELNDIEPASGFDAVYE